MKKISKWAVKVDVIARVFKGLNIVGGVVVLICLIAFLSFEDIVYGEMDFGMTLSFVDFDWIPECNPDVQTMRFFFVGILLFAILILAVRYYEIVIIRRIIKPMTEERPFDASVVKNIRDLSWVILIGDGMFSVIDFVMQICLYHTFDYENIFLSDKIISVSADYNFDFSFVWLFLVLHLLSYVFQYGQELQIQSDETL